MDHTAHAVILVAGEGKRLRPFTLSNPKCFARVSGRRILDNAMEALADNGCRRVRIVIGHHGDLVRDTISNRFAGMSIDYITNAEYRSTNSMYSLALGLDGLDEPTWILEGDVFFERSILSMPTTAKITWFVDSAVRHLDGAYVEADAEGQARGLKIIRDLRNLQENQNKSIGLLRVNREGVCHIRQWLQNGIEDGRQNDYYDLILRDHMHEGLIRVCDIAGRKWFEIDTPEDLEKACLVFQPKARRTPQ